jgi:Leucine-rich repeat (LRR) protein
VLLEFYRRRARGSKVRLTAHSRRLREGDTLAAFATVIISTWNEAMQCVPKRLFVALALIVAAAGCPSSAPPAAPQSVGSTKTVDESSLKQDPDAVAALKAAGAALTMNSNEQVIGVQLSESGGDKELERIQGLPFVRDLEADVRGVTDAGLALLAGHPNLRAIKLERSAVSDAGMMHLQKIPKLEDLDVRRLGITVAGYKEIGKISGLKRLRVVYNSLNFQDDCLLAVKDLKNLELLDMQDCNLPTEKGLVVLQGFSKLRNLRMYGPNINDKVLSYLKGARDLRVLSLEQCSGVTGAGLEHVNRLPNLIELSLYGTTGLKDADMEKLAPLSKLQKLDLRSTPITSLALSYLKGMKDLKELDLSETANVGNEGLEHIQGLTKLEKLVLWSCNIDDGGLANLKGLTKLKHLNLDKCIITDAGLIHLQPLKGLEYLHIGSTQVTDAGLQHLYGLKNLRQLVLTYLSDVTDDGIEKLQQQLPTLEEIER